jgi:hypothetical protein
MDMMTKDKIYNELLGVTLEISFDQIPDPSHINSQLGLCHNFMEQVEKHGITVNREISMTQRLLTNSLSHYEFLRQELMSSNAEIRTLPNIKDREAKADSLLRDNLDTVRQHKNELSDLKNLIRVINMKQKSLYRINNDIKLQIRLLESQLKIENISKDDPAERSLMEEFRKSSFNQDSFAGSTSTEDTSSVIDDSSPSEINRVLQEIPNNLINPEPNVSSIHEIVAPNSACVETIIESTINTQGGTPATPNKEMPVDAKPKEELQETVSEETVSEEGIATEDDIPVAVSEDLLKEVDLSIQNMGKGIEGIIPPTVEKTPEPKKAAPTPVQEPKQVTKSKDSVDIDALLKDFK